MPTAQSKRFGLLCCVLSLKVHVKVQHTTRSWDAGAACWLLVQAAAAALAHQLQQAHLQVPHKQAPLLLDGTDWHDCCCGPDLVRTNLRQADVLHFALCHQQLQRQVTRVSWCADRCRQRARSQTQKGTINIHPSVVLLGEKALADSMLTRTLQ